MSPTSFPWETDQPKLDVTLPVGRHVLKLFVKDDAGVISKADTVTITVEKEQAPNIIHIDPSCGCPGDVLHATLCGTHLKDILSITVFRERLPDARARVKECTGGTPEKVSVSIHIDHGAALGLRVIQVETEQGIATIPFEIVTCQLPRIDRIAPVWGPLGSVKKPVTCKVEGANLTSAGDVRLLLDGQTDECVTAKIRSSDNKRLDLDIAIAVDAALGARSLSVTTPTGREVRPEGVAFSVWLGWLQLGIVGLTLATVLMHFALSFPNPVSIPIGLVYLGLLAALYLPFRWLAGQRTWVRLVFIAYTAVFMVGLIATHQQAKLELYMIGVEAALLVLLLTESYQASHNKSVRRS